MCKMFYGNGLAEFSDVAKTHSTCAARVSPKRGNVMLLDIYS